MENYKAIETDELVEMLAECTADYVEMLKSVFNSDGFTACRTKIAKLQEEITLRQNAAATADEVAFTLTAVR
jgi:hypothetical protein